LDTITVKIPHTLLEEIDRLIEGGWYANRSEVIRDGIREIIDRRRHVLLRKAVEEDIEWARNESDHN
jgi:putative addiction module CopG family antidote